MSNQDFNLRLARLADAVRALDGGADLGRQLLQLATDMDAYLEAARGARYEQGIVLFQRWNEFLNTSVEDAHRYHRDRRVYERRRLAQLIATDPRWGGGYADLLQLLGNIPEE